jgi:Uma2 family endonuclease
MGPEQRMSVEDYERLAAGADVRYEFFHGEVFAMAGATDRHNEVAVNLAIALRAQLQGRGCKVYIGDVRLEVEVGGHYTYPDVFVTCDPRDQADAVTKRHARMVFEVLSADTESYDRGLKAQQYRKMPSLQALVLLDAEHGTMELQTRNDAGSWTLRVFDGMGDEAVIGEEARLRLSEVFARQE